MTHVERAMQVWQVLISAAHNRQVLTYEIVADSIGLGQHGKGAIALSTYLGTLMRYCDAHRLPPITALVVKKGIGIPGKGLRTLSPHPDKDREDVFRYDWFKKAPLTLLDLRPFAK
jgi:hypothetical protein